MIVFILGPLVWLVGSVVDAVADVDRAVAADHGVLVEPVLDLVAVIEIQPAPDRADRARELQLGAVAPAKQGRDPDLGHRPDVVRVDDVARVDHAVRSPRRSNARRMPRSTASAISSAASNAFVERSPIVRNIAARTGTI